MRDMLYAGSFGGLQHALGKVPSLVDEAAETCNARQPRDFGRDADAVIKNQANGAQS